MNGEVRQQISWLTPMCKYEEGGILLSLMIVECDQGPTSTGIEDMARIAVMTMWRGWRAAGEAQGGIR